MKESNQRRVLIRILKYLSCYKKSIIIVISIMTISSIISVILPFLAKDVIDNKIPLGKINAVLSVILIYIILALILSLLSIIRVRIMSRVSNKVVLKIRDEVFKHLQTLDLHYFNSHPTGNILSRIIGDISSLKQLVTQLVSTLIPQTMFLISLIIAMVVLNPVLAFGSLLSLPIVLIGTFIIMRVNFKRWYDYRKKQSELAGFSHEAFAGIKVIQSLACEEAEKKSFEKINDDILSSWIRCVRFGDTLGIIIDLSIGVGFLFLYLFAIYIDHSTVGELIAFSTYIMLFWQPIKALAQMFNQVSNNLSGASRVFEILDEKEEIPDSKDAVVMTDCEGNVQFDHVKFGYTENNTLIHDMNIDVKKGHTIAIVGPTGAGKTTLINLLMRFYEVDDGRILIDGIDIRDMTRESLRNTFGMVLQDTWSFKGTIKENIAYGRMGATDEEIIEAAKAAHADHFIRTLEHGYDTELNEEASNISQGQKQLLTIARAILADPKILILDEATSSVDTRTEVAIQKAMDKLMHGRTSFVIAHRLSTIKDADLILVMNHGNVIEQGTHKELLAQKGFYADLYNSQFAGKAI